MIIEECLRRINFKVGTLDDLSGRAVNPIVSNQAIIDELNSQLNQYANITKGIQDIYSLSLSRNQSMVSAPSLALRSESYFYAYIINNATIYPMDIRPPRSVFKNFRYNPINGITNWIMPFNEGNTHWLGAFPTNNINAKATTLNGSISSTDSTITVTSTTGFIANNGRITIESEKISYVYKDATHFYNCTRGVEMTTAASHSTATAVTENNVILFYSRLPIKIVINTDDTVPSAVSNRELEIVEEHLEGIIKLVSYNILIKLDPERANNYKVDAESLFDQYAQDIKKGYYRGRIGTNMEDPFPGNESGTPYGTNLTY